MSRYGKKAVQHSMRKLKQRIAYAKRKGYAIDERRIYDKLEDYTTPKQKINFMDSLKMNQLIGYKYEHEDDYTDREFSEFMNLPEELQEYLDYIDNTYGVDEEDYDIPEDRIMPEPYSIINQIEFLINQYPLELDVYGDIGDWMPYHVREVVSTEWVGQRLWEVWNNTVMEATRQDKLQELADYYYSVEEELAEVLNPYIDEERYYYESEINADLTQLLRLLNWGIPLTADQMEELSDLYSNDDVDISMWKD